MTPYELIKAGSEFLKKNNIKSYIIDSEIILSNVSLLVTKGLKSLNESVFDFDMVSSLFFQIPVLLSKEQLLRKKRMKDIASNFIFANLISILLLLPECLTWICY